MFAGELVEKIREVPRDTYVAATASGRRGALRSHVRTEEVGLQQPKGNSHSGRWWGWRRQQLQNCQLSDET